MNSRDWWLTCWSQCIGLDVGLGKEGAKMGRARAGTQLRAEVFWGWSKGSKPAGCGTKALPAPAEAAGTEQERRGARKGVRGSPRWQRCPGEAPRWIYFSCVTLSRDPRDPGGGGVLHLNYRVPGESRGLLFALNLPAADFS